MLEPVFTSKFKKYLKLQKKRGKSAAKIAQMIEYICENGDAPALSKPHNLAGEWSGYRECHIELDHIILKMMV